MLHDCMFKTKEYKMSDMPSADFSIMNLSNKELQALKPVKVLDIYDGGSDNFHEDGLFSVSIFGRVGDANRDLRFSYIATGIQVLHPLIFINVVKLKRFYSEIIKGSAYAIFDDKKNDFVVSDAIDGETGYNFFLSYWDRIVFEKNDSKQRNARIDFIEKYRKIAKTSNILVLPAGLRDLEVDPDGRDIEGEINEFYRRIISISNTLSSSTNVNNRITDSARLGIQNAFNSIYSYIISLCRGKGGFILHKWARRKVFNSTRAVLTAQVPSVNKLSDKDYPSWNNTVLGIAQLMKGLLPYAVHRLMGFELVAEAFPSGDSSAYLLDKKTLKREMVNIPNRVTDEWTTHQGVEGLFQKFMDHHVRASNVEIHGYYIGLIYRGPDKTFKILYDIDDVDNYPWMDKKHVYPITWVEMIYLMGYKEWNTFPMVTSRYPISGSGSIYPSYTYVKTTVLTESRWGVDNDGNKIDEDRAIVYPILDNPTFIDSEAVSPSRLEGMGADFDGDMISGIILYSEDSKKEIETYLNTAAAYIRPNDGLLNSPYTDPIDRVIHNMTGD